jgi:hypothetical protein
VKAVGPPGTALTACVPSRSAWGLFSTALFTRIVWAKPA